MAAQQPTYQAYTVVKREGQDDFWLNIGAAFMHQDGEGFNIVLQALPHQRQDRPAPAQGAGRGAAGNGRQDQRAAPQKPPRKITAL